MSRGLGLKPEDGLEIPAIRDNSLEKLPLGEGENYGYYKGLITVEKNGKTVRVLQLDQTVTDFEK